MEVKGVRVEDKIKKALLLIGLALLVPNMALALLRVYAVDPVKAQWSEWTDTVPGRNYVSQIITCNFDS